MLITNPLYSTIDMYLTNLEKHTETDCHFEYFYKSYEKNKDDIISYLCFEIKSLLKYPQNIIIKSIKYGGFLKFEYHKTMKEIYISELPFIDDGKNKFYIFTQDIALILSKVIANTVDLKTVKIKFINDFFLCAIDKKTIEVLPSISLTNNWNLLVRIRDGIQKEIVKIKAETIRYKEKQERKNNAEERALIKKRKVQGIDPDAFENYDLFVQALKEHILSKNAKRKENLKPKLNSCIHKYKELLLSYGFALINDMPPLHLWEAKEEQYKKLSIEKKLDTWLDFDLNHECGLLYTIESIKQELRESYYHHEIETFPRVDSYAMYNELTERAYSHPSLSKNDFKILELFISLIYNIRALHSKINLCSRIDNKPLEYVYRFSQHSTSSPWANVLKMPYWQKRSFDEFKTCNLPESYNLFMIQPGVNKIDYSKIFSFDETPSGSYGLSDNYVFKRFIVTIPKTLSYTEVWKLVNYILKRAVNINFICEDTTNYIIIKRILILKELDNLYNPGIEKITFSDKSIKWFVNLDPNYYNDYMVTTPKNKTYWHKFDFTSDYKYRRKDPLDIKAIVAECVNKMCSNQIDLSIKRAEIERILLGDITGHVEAITERTPEKFENIYKGYKLEHNFKKTLRKYCAFGGTIGRQKYLVDEIFIECITDNDDNTIYIDTARLENTTLLEEGLFEKDLNKIRSYLGLEKESNTLQDEFPYFDFDFEVKRKEITSKHISSFKNIIDFLNRININRLFENRIFIDGYNQDNAYIISNLKDDFYAIEYIKADYSEELQDDCYLCIFFVLIHYKNEYRICLIEATPDPNLSNHAFINKQWATISPEKLSDNIQNRIFEKFVVCAKEIEKHNLKLTRSKAEDDFMHITEEDFPW